MAGKDVYNNNDSSEISELASLNNDISDDLLDQLQQKVAQDVGNLNDKINPNDDSTLFEEPVQENKPSSDVDEQKQQKSEPVPADSAEPKSSFDFDDDFARKFRAKQNKQEIVPDTTASDDNSKDEQKESSDGSVSDNASEQIDDESIEKITKGNITEKMLTKEQKEYNDSLDFLDGNVKYSKYVIYIDPQNVDFIEGLSVKERKNLINNILHQQDCITKTEKKMGVIQSVIKHAIVALLTVSISIPVIYYVINASLEATINNHRRSQSNWQVLYREHGKITNKR